MVSLCNILLVALCTCSFFEGIAFAGMASLFAEDQTALLRGIVRDAGVMESKVPEVSKDEMKVGPSSLALSTKIPAFESCPDVICFGEACPTVSPDMDPCEEGFICAGNPGERKCVPPLRARVPCGTNPLRVCGAGLLCENGMCANLRTKGQTCNPEFDVCTATLICGGPQGRERCVVPVGGNEFCSDDVFKICDFELICGGTEDRTFCATPIGKFQSCTLQEKSCGFSGSGSRLVCAGTSSNKRCVFGRKLNERCGRNAFEVCELGLVCAGPDGNKRCANEISR